jgi:hypothetical protein
MLSKVFSGISSLADIGSFELENTTSQLSSKIILVDIITRISTAATIVWTYRKKTVLKEEYLSSYMRLIETIR